jgi:hypothetical protein
MIDVSFYMIKLTILKRWIRDNVDGVETMPLDDRYYRAQVQYELGLINKRYEKPSSEVVIITDHAFERAKERLSMNKAAFVRVAERAYLKGIGAKHVSGNLKRYLNGRFLQSKIGNIVVHGENLFMFKKNLLITVYQLPNNLRKCAIKMQRA